MAKLRLIFCLILFIPVLVLSMFFALLPATIMRWLHLFRAEQWWTLHCAQFVSNYIFLIVGLRTHVEGKENLPKDMSRICYVANHQSMLDVPLFFAKAGLTTGIIAKVELKRVPILNWWCFAMRCIFINRKSPRSSVKAILAGVEQIKQGHPILIFPEGTRSKTGAIAPFKSGSFKLATRSKAIIVPIVIRGTRQGFEEMEGWRRKKDAYLSICKPIDTASLNEEGLSQLNELVQREVESRYDELAKLNG